MEPLLALLVVAPGAVALALLRRHDRRRRGALAALADERGWSYTPRDDALARRFAGEPFGQGGRRRATHVLRGMSAGREVVAFDYSFVTYTHDGTQQRAVTHSFAVCALRLPTELPRLQLTGANVLTRAAGALTGSALLLENEEFNRRYHVTADDRRFAYDVLHPRLLEELLAAPTLNLRLQGADALTWERGSTSADTLPARLQTLARLVDGIPSYVWSDRRGTA